MAYRKPTGALLKALRPETYRMVVELLSEPREHVSYHEIERVCGVGGNTIKAIERAEAPTIAERRASLLSQSLRVAQRALDRIEGGVDNAPLSLLVPIYGVAIDKAQLLGGESPTARLEVHVNLPDLYSEFLEVSRAIKQAVAKELPLSPLPALEAEIVEG